MLHRSPRSDLGTPSSGRPERGAGCQVATTPLRQPSQGRQVEAPHTGRLGAGSCGQGSRRTDWSSPAPRLHRSNNDRVPRSVEAGHTLPPPRSGAAQALRTNEPGGEGWGEAVSGLDLTGQDPATTPSEQGKARRRAWVDMGSQHRRRPSSRLRAGQHSWQSVTQDRIDRNPHSRC